MPEIVLIYINEINFENTHFHLISQFSLKTLNSMVRLDPDSPHEDVYTIVINIATDDLCIKTHKKDNKRCKIYHQDVAQSHDMHRR